MGGPRGAARGAARDGPEAARPGDRRTDPQAAGEGGGAGPPSSRGGGAGTPFSPPGTPPARLRLGCSARWPPPGDSSDPAPRGKPGPRSPLALSVRLSGRVRVCVSQGLAARSPPAQHLIPDPGSRGQACIQRGQATPRDLVSSVLCPSSGALRSGFLPGRGVEVSERGLDLLPRP